MTHGAVEDRLTQNNNLVRKWVDDYCINQRNPALAAFDITEQPLTRDDVQASDVANRPGCYVIFTEAGNLKYVGMSWSRIGSRSLSHFFKAHVDPFWLLSSPPTYVTLIAVHEAWEAPSLEAFLTVKSVDCRKIADTEMQT